MEECDFGRAIELFEYWARFPPLHIMVRDYLGYEEPQPDTMEVAQVMQSVGQRKAAKLSGATELDRSIFEMQKENLANGRR